MSRPAITILIITRIIIILSIPSLSTRGTIVASESRRQTHTIATLSADEAKLMSLQIVTRTAFPEGIAIRLLNLLPGSVRPQAAVETKP